MLKIKLSPRGKKHQRTFRIVIQENKSKINGNFIDDLGFYTPQTKILNLDQVKLEQWQRNGAKLTLGINRLLHPDQFPAKKPHPKKPAAPIAETK